METSIFVGLAVAIIAVAYFVSRAKSSSSSTPPAAGGGAPSSGNKTPVNKD